MLFMNYQTLEYVNWSDKMLKTAPQLCPW